MNGNTPPHPHSVENDHAKSLLAEHQRTSHADDLTATEIIAVREILESDKRWRWVGAGIKTWAVWIAALIGAGTLGLEALKSAVKALGR